MTATSPDSKPVQLAARTVAWDMFPAYLVDHCEGRVITEEELQSALAQMLKNPAYASKASVVQDTRAKALDILGRADDILRDEDTESAEAARVEVGQAMQVLAAGAVESEYAANYLWLRDYALRGTEIGAFSPYVVKGQSMTPLEGPQLDAFVEEARGRAPKHFHIDMPPAARLSPAQQAWIEKAQQLMQITSGWQDAAGEANLLFSAPAAVVVADAGGLANGTGLAACPFCDGEAELARGYHSMVDAKVVCKDCGGEGPLCNDDGKTQDENSADAIAAWNRIGLRPPAAPAAASPQLALHDDVVREGFEQSHYCYGERPADRIMNWQVWQEAVEFAVRTLDESNPSLQAQLEVWYPVVEEVTLPPLEEHVLAATVTESVQLALGSTVRMLQEAAKRDKEECFYTHWRRLPSAPTVLLRAIKRLTRAPENQPSEG